MASSKGLRQVGYFDCAGGGQVVVDNGIAAIGHQRWPQATTIVDVSDPKSPKHLATIDGLPEFTHCHKVRIAGDIMVVNYEPMKHLGPTPKEFVGGLGVYDISKKSKPRKLAHWACDGVHRFTFDGRYAYISPQLEGFIGNIVAIIDLKNPEKPEEVMRWWQPGQWVGGGETPEWDISDHELVPRCHHPIRMGNHLYTSYWHGGGHILDISDMSKPKLVSSISWSPPFPWPTHTLLPIPFPIRDRRYMMVADEDALPKYPGPGPYLWMVDITDLEHPAAVSSFDAAPSTDLKRKSHTGLHQPDETVRGTEIPVAWHIHGLRIVDIADPHCMKEVAHFMPDPAPGQPKLQTNDVCSDDRGLIYIIDRLRGMHIVERT